MNFKDYLKSSLNKADFQRVWDSFFESKSVGFYLNLLKFDKDYIISNLDDLGVEFREILPNFYLCKAEFKEILTHSELFNKGAIYIQNPSSYLAVLALNPAKNDIVLDMCASPGGKSIALANMMGYGADLAVMESDSKRFYTLKANLNKYGCEWVRTYNKDARSISRSCVGRFDKILLDAPCSSYSHFGDGFVEKTAKEIKSLSKLQKQLLNSALSALKLGGCVVYSTCTLFECENEEVIKNALGSKFDISIQPISFGLKGEIVSEFGLRILPDCDMDAFFLAKIVKNN